MREIPAELFGLRHALRTARRPRLRSCRPASRRHRLGEPDRHHSTTNIPGAGGLVNKQTKGRSVRCVPILQPLAPVLERLTADREPDTGLVTGPRGGVLTTATVRDATTWDSIFTELGLPNLTRHGLRHTGATWFADAGIPLHVLEKIPGHQSLETTLGYLHPTTATCPQQPKRTPSSADGRRQKKLKRKRLVATDPPGETEHEPPVRIRDKTLKRSRPNGTRGCSGPLLIPLGDSRPRSWATDCNQVLRRRPRQGHQRPSGLNYEDLIKF